MKHLFPQEIIRNSGEGYFVTQNTSGKAIYLTLVFLLLILAVLLPVVKIDITTQSSGQIRSRFDDNILQSAVYGEIVRANIAENLAVKQGDTLLVISTQKTDEQINYYKLQVEEETIHLNDLTSLLANRSSKLTSTLFKQEYAGYRGKLEEQKVKMAQVDKDFALASTLYGKKVIPKTEYDDKRSNHEIEISRYQNICEQQKLAWQTRLTDLTTKIEGLKSNIEQLQRDKKQYVMTAPLSGTITAYTGVKQGNFIVPNQQIGRISPDNELLVECYITPANIGLIHEEMNVTFQFHSFNYNQWGIGTGKVIELSNNVVSIDNQPYFKVRCSLDQSFLQLKNGYKGYLKKGMTLTGRFKITKRSLFQLLYDKTDNWLNPKISGNEL